ncbi:hypothetical protein P3T40_002842 [Paraburkholderia sp. EB58]|jgi:hypothetical protein|uniref:hypothetical protein n=1 Tax=Paraburkholderia sp. EB58 TaxID=3035125 RepID=UPI003D211281
MAGETTSEYGGTVLPRKIRSSLRGILGWDAYKQYSRGLPGLERRLLFNQYSGVCAHMARWSTQWSTQLMIEWDGTWEKSNYLAAYERTQAPEKVRELADYRLQYLELLYNLLPKHESDVYGELLSPCFLSDGCMPDVKAVSVIYKLQDFLMLSFAVGGSKEVTSVSRILDEALGTVMDAPSSNKDSLFARLMLNAAVNRCHLELSEQSRLDRQAKDGMVPLVLHLQRLFWGGVLPEVTSIEEVREKVISVMNLPAEGYANWRRFKGNSLDKVLERAHALADTDRMIAQSPESERYRWRYVLLTCLAVAWSYCTEEEFDTRLVGANRRDRQVIGGRSKEDAHTYPPNLTLYHRRQFKLLWIFAHMPRLDPGRVVKRHADVQAERDLHQAYLGRFKHLTLWQWGKLDESLSSLLRGTRWDELAPLVDSNHLATLR